MVVANVRPSSVPTEPMTEQPRQDTAQVQAWLEVNLGGTVKGQADVIVVFWGGLVIDDWRCSHASLRNGGLGR